VSLTVQLSAAVATHGAGGGPTSRETFSRHSARSAGASGEQARSLSIASPAPPPAAPCASAPALVSPRAKATQVVAIFIAWLAAGALGDRAIPAPPGSGRGRGRWRRD